MDPSVKYSYQSRRYCRTSDAAAMRQIIRMLRACCQMSLRRAPRSPRANYPRNCKERIICSHESSRLDVFDGEAAPRLTCAGPFCCRPPKSPFSTIKGLRRPIPLLSEFQTASRGEMERFNPPKSLRRLKGTPRANGLVHRDLRLLRRLVLERCLTRNEPQDLDTRMSPSARVRRKLTSPTSEIMRQVVPYH